MRNFLFALLVVIASSIVAPAYAQSAFARVDMKEGSQPFVVYQFTLNGWEFYAFDAHNNPQWEAGRELKAFTFGKQYVSLSGYGSYKSVAGEFFLLPWLHAHGPIPALNATYSVNLASYIPLNGGSHFTFSDGTQVMWKLSDRISVGGALKYGRAEGGSDNFGLGPKLSLKVRKNLTVHLVYFAMQEGSDIVRVQPVVNF